MDPVIVTTNNSIECDNTNSHCPSAILASKCNQENFSPKSYSIPVKLIQNNLEVPQNKGVNRLELQNASPFITVEEAMNHFKSLNLPKDLSRLQPERTKFSELLRFFKPPPKLHPSLCSELDLIYSITQCSLDWSDQVQHRMLLTVYRKLTGAESDCPPRGSHWQLIGFQGNDPATDLRAVGLFGLLQFLYLTSENLLPLGHRLFTVANSETQPFPLAVLSLNITNIVLNVMNSGKLNRECNNKNSVLEVLNSFYAALLVYVLNAWVSQNKTIRDSGYLLKDAERYCSRNVRRVLKDLPHNLSKYQN